MGSGSSWFIQSRRLRAPPALPVFPRRIRSDFACGALVRAAEKHLAEVLRCFYLASPSVGLVVVPVAPGSRYSAASKSGRFRRVLSRPPVNFCMIAAEQNLGHRPAAEFGGTRVVGEIEAEATRAS